MEILWRGEIQSIDLHIVDAQPDEEGYAENDVKERDG